MTQDVYLVIGNTDRKLSPEEWAAFQAEFRASAEAAAEKVWGVWHSDPDGPYRNMCIGLLLAEEATASLKDQLRRLAARYRQESIAWSTAETELLQARNN